MNVVQVDFIKTIERYFPFLAEDDALTDALCYALALSETNEDDEWEAVIEGKRFISREKESRWCGDLLT